MGIHTSLALPETLVHIITVSSPLGNAWKTVFRCTLSCLTDLIQGSMMANQTKSLPSISEYTLCINCAFVWELVIRNVQYSSRISIWINFFVGFLWDFCLSTFKNLQKSYKKKFINIEILALYCIKNYFDMDCFVVCILADLRLM